MSTIQQFFSKSAINTINTAEAVAIDSTAASITVGAALADGQTLKLGKNGATEMIFTPHGTAGNEKISLTNTAGTEADAIAFTSTNGGVTLTPASGKNVSIGGILAISTELASSPSAPNNGAGGYLYTKADGKPYWVSNDVSETDLSASGSGASLSGTTPNEITTVTGANAIQGESKLTFNGTTLAVTGALTTSTTITATGNITGSALMINTPSNLTDSTAASITSFAKTIVHIDMSGANTNVSSGTMTGVAGQIVHILYKGHGSYNYTLNFGTDGLVSGGGTNDSLIFKNTGDSASLVYVDSKWHVINTGATVA